MAQTAAESPNSKLVEEVSGKDCGYCNEGTLTEGEYKGTPAVLCPNCGTPTVRLF